MQAFVNGTFVPEEQATVSIFDRGLMFGDGVFDMTRTFGGRPFRLDEHIERLGRSLRYIEIDEEPVLATVRGVIPELLRLNEPAIRELGDAWISILVTRGTMGERDFLAGSSPTVVVMVRRISFATFAHLYDSGVDLGLSLVTRHPAGALDARVKSISRLSFIRSELKMLRQGMAGGRWTVAFNDDGSIAETSGANLCVLDGGRLVRPPRRQALEGVSLRALCELASDLGIDTEERSLTEYDLINADEAYITSSSFCVLPVASVDGIPLRRGEVYGRLVDRWIDLVGLDFVAQAKEIAGQATAGAEMAEGVPHA